MPGGCERQDILNEFNISEYIYYFWFDTIKESKGGGTGLILYFAYGSCMDELSFKRTVGENGYKLMGRAVLPDFRLAFTLYSPNRMGGVADLLWSPGEKVEGILYQLNPEVLKDLDEREGVSHGRYKRIQVNVCHQGQKKMAMTYTVVKKESKEVCPHPSYLKEIMRGAGRLSREYQEQLRKACKERFGISV
jgi:cation transport regulator ChaC